jgi:heme exporter protein D
MTWGSWQAFWAMGGYGLYVWGSYVMVALVLAIEIWQLMSRRRAAELEVERDGARARRSQ